MEHISEVITKGITSYLGVQVMNHSVISLMDESYKETYIIYLDMVEDSPNEEAVFLGINTLRDYLKGCYPKILKFLGNDDHILFYNEEGDNTLFQLMDRSLHITVTFTGQY